MRPWFDNNMSRELAPRRSQYQSLGTIILQNRNCILQRLNSRSEHGIAAMPKIGGARCSWKGAMMAPRICCSGSPYRLRGRRRGLELMPLRRLSCTVPTLSNSRALLVDPWYQLVVVSQIGRKPLRLSQCFVKVVSCPTGEADPRRPPQVCLPKAFLGVHSEIRACDFPMNPCSLTLPRFEFSPISIVDILDSLLWHRQ